MSESDSQSAISEKNSYSKDKDHKLYYNSRHGHSDSYIKNRRRKRSSHSRSTIKSSQKRSKGFTSIENSKLHSKSSIARGRRNISNSSERNRYKTYAKYRDQDQSEDSDRVNSEIRPRKKYQASSEERESPNKKNWWEVQSDTRKTKSRSGRSVEKKNRNLTKSRESDTSLNLEESSSKERKTVVPFRNHTAGNTVHRNIQNDANEFNERAYWLNKSNGTPYSGHHGMAPMPRLPDFNNNMPSYAMNNSSYRYPMPGYMPHENTSSSSPPQEKHDPTNSIDNPSVMANPPLMQHSTVPSFYPGNIHYQRPMECLDHNVHKNPLDISTSPHDTNQLYLNSSETHGFDNSWDKNMYRLYPRIPHPRDMNYGIPHANMNMYNSWGMPYMPPCNPRMRPGKQLTQSIECALNTDMPSWVFMPRLQDYYMQQNRFKSFPLHRQVHPKLGSWYPKPMFPSRQNMYKMQFNSPSRQYYMPNMYRPENPGRPYGNLTYGSDYSMHVPPYCANQQSYPGYMDLLMNDPSGIKKKNDDQSDISFLSYLNSTSEMDYRYCFNLFFISCLVDMLDSSPNQSTLQQLCIPNKNNDAFTEDDRIQQYKGCHLIHYDFLPNIHLIFLSYMLSQKKSKSFQKKCYSLTPKNDTLLENDCSSENNNNIADKDENTKSIDIDTGGGTDIDLDSNLNLTYTSNSFLKGLQSLPIDKILDENLMLDDNEIITDSKRIESSDNAKNSLIECNISKVKLERLKQFVSNNRIMNCLQKNKIQGSLQSTHGIIPECTLLECDSKVSSNYPLLSDCMKCQEYSDMTLLDFSYNFDLNSYDIHSSSQLSLSPEFICNLDSSGDHFNILNFSNNNPKSTEEFRTNLQMEIQLLSTINEFC